MAAGGPSVHRDYYAEGERVVGHWQGRGAAELGLEGEVTEPQFEAIRQGLHPATGEMLRPRHSADRRSVDGEIQSRGRHLYDFTLSAPKSVSVVAALAYTGGPWPYGYRGLGEVFVFVFFGLVAVVGVFRGIWPALVCATMSFLLVDYFFVPPIGMFTIADEQDIVNLVAFLATAGFVGLLGSRRRTAQMHAEALALQLQEANTELVRLNKEQAEAATAALRLARSEQQIKALQESDRLRRELLANVSHELRTPLGTILRIDPGLESWAT